MEYRRLKSKVGIHFCVNKNAFFKFICIFVKSRDDIYQYISINILR